MKLTATVTGPVSAVYDIQAFRASIEIQNLTEVRNNGRVLARLKPYNFPME